MLDPTAMTAPRIWLDACGLDDRGYRHWWVELTIDAESGAETQVQLRVYPHGWGVAFRHGDKLASLRMAGAQREIERDDLGVLDEITELSRFGALLELLERRYAIAFRRHSAMVRSNLPGARSVVRGWLGAV